MYQLKLSDGKRALILIVVLGIALLGYIKHTTLDIKNINGKIIFQDPATEGGNRGLVILSLPQKSVSPLGIYGDKARFMDSDSRIIVSHMDGKVSLYDTKSNTQKVVYKSENKEMGRYEIASVDKSHFSVVDNNNLFLVNICDGTKKKMFNYANSEYSWANNGKTLYYDKKIDGKTRIIKYDIDTGKEVQIDVGSSPRISKDGSVIVYWCESPIKNEGHYLKVKNLNTNEEWKYTWPIFDYCLSPDGKYLATVEHWRGIGFYKAYTVKVVDYKNGKSKKVLDKYANGCTDIDWIE